MNDEPDQIEGFRRSGQVMLLRNAKITAQDHSADERTHVTNAEMHFGPQKDFYKNAREVLDTQNRMPKRFVKHSLAMKRIEVNVSRVKEMVHVMDPKMKDDHLLLSAADDPDGNIADGDGSTPEHSQVANMHAHEHVAKVEEAVSPRSMHKSMFTSPYASAKSQKSIFSLADPLHSLSPRPDGIADDSVAKRVYDREGFESLVKKCDEMVALEDRIMEKRNTPLVGTDTASILVVIMLKHM
jgi:hypothetical protein